MTDLEITRLCAEAMGLHQVDRYRFANVHGQEAEYTPLHDDAQAMALVKKFHPYIDGLLMDDWTVAFTNGAFSYEVRDKDLNRAICECCAKLQAGKLNAG